MQRSAHKILLFICVNIFTPTFSIYFQDASDIIDYEAIVEKGAEGVGLGIIVVEDKTRRQVEQFYISALFALVAYLRPLVITL